MANHSVVVDMVVDNILTTTTTTTSFDEYTNTASSDNYYSYSYSIYSNTATDDNYTSVVATYASKKNLTIGNSTTLVELDISIHC